MPNQKITILLIEDDALIVRMYQVKFKESGYKIIFAFNGQEGIELAKKEKPNIILLDIMMPKMDGFRTLEILKKEPETKKIPVIILSNLGEEKAVQKGMGLGAIDYLIKSQLTPAEVVKKVEDIIKKEVG